MNLSNTHLFNDDHYFIYPKDRRDEVTKLPFIEFQADPIYINQIKQWYNDNLEQDYHATITVDQVATCKEMLISGVGVTILPEIMMKNIDKNMFEFEKVTIDNDPLIRSTYMSYDQSMLQLPQVDSFVNLMLNFIRSCWYSWHSVSMCLMVRVVPHPSHVGGSSFDMRYPCVNLECPILCRFIVVSSFLLKL